MDKKFLSSKLTGKRSKMKIYVKTVRPHGNRCGRNLNFDGGGRELFNDFRKKNPEEEFFGPLQERGGWRICANHELNKLIGGANMVRSVKAERFKWWGHVHRMEQCRIVRRIFEWSSMGKRSRGHPGNRWWDEVLKDIRVLDVKIWANVLMDRWAWHDLVGKSKTHRGL
jgi:hypothetical protein